MKVQLFLFALIAVASFAPAAQAGILLAGVTISPDPQLAAPGTTVVVQVSVRSNYPHNWTLQVENEDALVVASLPANTTVFSDRGSNGTVTMSVRVSAIAPVGSRHLITVVATTAFPRSNYSITGTGRVDVIAPPPAARAALRLEQMDALDDASCSTCALPQDRDWPMRLDPPALTEDANDFAPDLVMDRAEWAHEDPIAIEPPARSPPSNETPIEVAPASHEGPNELSGPYHSTLPTMESVERSQASASGAEPPQMPGGNGTYGHVARHAWGDLNGDDTPSTFAIMGAVDRGVARVAPSMAETDPEE